jgi:hypothetical protein
MNPNNVQQNFELPQPLKQGANEQDAKLPEQLPLGRSEGTPAASSTSAPQDDSSLLGPLLPAGVPAAPLTVTTQPTNPVAADDSELIEKEWVQKAKQIVASTKDDPYTQNKEINRFKADYLKKRYNKDIKVEES